MADLDPLIDPLIDPTDAELDAAIAAFVDPLEPVDPGSSLVSDQVPAGV